MRIQIYVIVNLKGGIKISVTEKGLVKKAENQIAKNKKKNLDIGLLVTIFVLLALGLMMVLSASAPSALNYQGDSYHYFSNQAKNALIRNYSECFSFQW